MKVAVVNVGTIGHVDHGLTTLSTSLARMGVEVEYLSTRQMLERPLSDFVEVYSDTPHSCLAKVQRKAERKARMRAAQLRAFEGRR